MPCRVVVGYRTTAGGTGEGVTVRRLASLALVGAAINTAFLLERASDERNVRALVRHVGCSKETARRLHRLARQEGYGAAYVRVFPGQGIRGIQPFEDDSTFDSHVAAS
jgi:hypothetical protein